MLNIKDDILKNAGLILCQLNQKSLAQILDFANIFWSPLAHNTAKIAKVNRFY